ncbi:MAG: LysE family translocator [Crocinitomicaceae bacterium]|nr:LysE family translocator [Crocinitomicaceae bacterium]
MALFTGLLLGLGTLLFIGPVFFYLIKSTLESGFKAGIFVALGIILGDILCLLIALYGSNEFMTRPTFVLWASIIGGALLLFMGLKYVLKPNLDTTVKGRLQISSLLVYGINGFLINFVNPFVFAVWFGFVSYTKALYDNGTAVFSLVITLSVIFSTDVLKALFAERISWLIEPQKLKNIFRVFGALMICFSIRLLLHPFL